MSNISQKEQGYVQRWGLCTRTAFLSSSSWSIIGGCEWWMMDGGWRVRVTVDGVVGGAKFFFLLWQTACCCGNTLSTKGRKLWCALHQEFLENPKSFYSFFRILKFDSCRSIRKTEFWWLTGSAKTCLQPEILLNAWRLKSHRHQRTEPGFARPSPILIGVLFQAQTCDCALPPFYGTCKVKVNA